jgi:hypothetical protein
MDIVISILLFLQKNQILLIFVLPTPNLEPGLNSYNGSLPLQSVG